MYWRDSGNRRLEAQGDQSGSLRGSRGSFSATFQRYLRTKDHEEIGTAFALIIKKTFPSRRRGVTGSRAAAPTAQVKGLKGGNITVFNNVYLLFFSFRWSYCDASARSVALWTVFLFACFALLPVVFCLSSSSLHFCI
jgi:hypothetical protein